MNLQSRAKFEGTDFKFSFNDYKGDLTRAWYVDIQTYNHTAGVWKRNRFKGGVNRIHSLGKRQTAFDAFCAANLELLKAGTHPAYGERPKGNTSVSPVPENLKEALVWIIGVAYGESGNTRDTYKGAASLFIKWLDDELLTAKDITTARCYQYQDYMKTVRKVSAKTNNNNLRRLNALFSHLGRRDESIVNPFEKVKRLKVIQTEDNVHNHMSKQEAKKTYELLLRTNPNLYLATLFISTSFLRTDEIPQVKVRHINIEKGFVILHGEHQKNGKTSQKILSKEMITLINDLGIMALDPDAYVFHKKCLPAVASTPVGDKVVSKIFTKLVREVLGYPNTFYSMRHFGAYMLAEYGFSLVKISVLMGHADVATTAEYLKKHNISYHNETIDLPSLLNGA